MAKDGTMRGGRRAGSGAKKKPLADKIAEGNLGHRPMKVIDIPEPAEIPAGKIPTPKTFLSRKQAGGDTLQARKIYRKTWEWLADRGVAELVNPDSVERYAMSAARWIQCEEAISRYGLTAKHPTTGEPIASPYVTMGEKYKQAMYRDWSELYQIVKDNCEGDYKKTPHKDMMEELFRKKSL